MGVNTTTEGNIDKDLGQEALEQNFFHAVEHCPQQVHGPRAEHLALRSSEEASVVYKHRQAERVGHRCSGTGAGTMVLAQELCVVRIWSLLW